MRSQAQVVVIGGGAVGASCLYHLTQAGIRDCLLIEKDELTSGSTWHAAGNIPTYATSWLGMRAGNYGWRLYKDLDQKVDAAITYRHTGAFWPAHNAARMDFYNHLVGLSKSAGFDLAILTPQEMEALHPYYKAGPSVLGAIHDPYEGDIDPSQLTQALAKGARAAGAEVARFTRVTAISQSRDGGWRITSDKGSVDCETIVNATGFYGGQIAAMVGDALPVTTLEHQYLVTEPLSALEEDKALFPLVRDPDICFYLRRERASFLFGSYGHPGRPAFDEGLPEDFAHQLFADSPDDIVEVLEGALAHIPLLGDAGVQRMVNGPIAYAPDALPLCGPAKGLRNFYHACGIQVGITQSAAAGKAIAEWISEGETEWDMAAWDPRRFGDWASSAYGRARAIELYDLQYAIPFPHRLLASGRPLQRTPLYERLQEKGAVFGQIGGWERAFWFDLGGEAYDAGALSFGDDEAWRKAVARECAAVRDQVGIMDHGGFTKFEVEGPGASAFLERVFCGSLPKIGRVKLSYMLTPKGRIWSEATIARLAEDRYLLCGPTLAVDRDYDWLRDALPDDGSTVLRKGSSRDGALMVMGPASRDLLSGLTDADLSAEAMPWMSLGEIEIAGKAATALRVSYVGELGWELHLTSEDLPSVYEAIWQAGEAHGLVNFGSYALNAMRLEKGYHAWGADFGTEYTLFDAGLEGFAKLEKDAFVGREAVLAQSEQVPEWRFAAFRIQGAEADPLAGDPLFTKEGLIGYVTSGGTGYRLGERLALAYLENKSLPEDSSFEIEILGKRCRAEIASEAFYDPGNERLRG